MIEFWPKLSVREIGGGQVRYVRKNGNFPLIVPYSVEDPDNARTIKIQLCNMFFARNF